MAQHFFHNQVNSIFQLLREIQDNLIHAQAVGAQNYDAMVEEAKTKTSFMIRSIGKQHQHPLPPAQFNPKFNEVYQILVDMREQVNEAQQQQDPQFQAMRADLMDQEDLIEQFLNERFYEDFLLEGIRVLQGGKRKQRKSRKAKRKARKTRRR